MYDVMQLLKKHGTIIYTKDKLLDLELMEEEIKELYHAEIIDVKTFQHGVLLLRQERQKLV